MYKEYTIYTKDEDMLLSTEDTYSSDVKKLGAEQSDEHIESDIDVDLADQRNLMADETFICMRTYMDIDPLRLTMKIVQKVVVPLKRAHFFRQVQNM
jgi:hypothetical protein